MIVGAGDDSKIQRVGKPDDVRLLSLNRTDAFWRSIAQLDGIEPRVPMLLVLRNLADVAGNREYEQRRSAGDPERRVAHRIVPVATRINIECGIDPDRDDVLVLVARLQRGKQHRSVAGVLRILRRRCVRSSETLVVRDVGDVEARSRMPLAVALRREPLVGVPRCVGVAVKINYHIVCVVHRDRGHGPRDNRSHGVHHNDADQRYGRSAQLTEKRRSSRARPKNAPHDNAENDGYEQRRVLLEREQGERIHQRAERRQDRIDGRVYERRVGHREARLGIQDRGGAHNRRRQHQDRQYGGKDIAGSTLGSSHWP